MSLDFNSGFFAGFFLATFLGLVFGQIQKARRRIGAYYRPQAVPLQIAKTPQQVRADHFRAVFEIAGWVFTLVVGVSLFIYFLI